MALSVENKTAVEKMATSKINWTQYAAGAASLLVLFGIDLDTPTQLAFVSIIQGAQTVLTWVLRTFFHKPPA